MLGTSNIVRCWGDVVWSGEGFYVPYCKANLLPCFIQGIDIRRTGTPAGIVPEGDLVPVRSCCEGGYPLAQVCVALLVAGASPAFFFVYPASSMDRVIQGKRYKIKTCGNPHKYMSLHPRPIPVQVGTGIRKHKDSTSLLFLVLIQEFISQEM